MSRRHKKGRTQDPIAKEKKRIDREKRRRDERRVEEHEDRSGGYQGSEAHVTGRLGLDGPRG